MCLFGNNIETCKTGTYYNCGRDKTNGFLVEGCFDQRMCDPGSANEMRFNIRDEKASLLCVPCEKGKYQPFHSDSVSSTGELKGCQFKKSSPTLEEEIPKMMLIEAFGPFRPDQYACDSSQGYSDINKKMYCYVNDMCHCTRDFRCMNSSLPELLPDGSCDRKCADARDGKNNFSCASYAGSIKPPITIGPPKANGDPNDDWKVPLIVGIIATAFVIIVIITWCICHRRHRNNAKDQERDVVVNAEIYCDIRNRGNVTVRLPLLNPPEVGGNRNLPPEETKEIESLAQAVQEQGGMSSVVTDGNTKAEPQINEFKEFDESRLDESVDSIAHDDCAPGDNTAPKRICDED